MKAINLNGVIAVLEGSTWVSDDRRFERYLNRVADSISRELSIADGNPRQLIFNHVIELLPRAEVIDNDQPVTTTEIGVTP